MERYRGVRICSIRDDPNLKETQLIEGSDSSRSRSFPGHTKRARLLKQLFRTVAIDHVFVTPSA
jgi:hypothetical protein